MSTQPLHIYTRKEASEKGTTFKTKLKTDILDLIDSHTTLKKARNNQLLSYDALISELDFKYRSGEIIQNLIQLKLDKLIAMVPGFVFNAETNKITAIIYMLSKPLKTAIDIHGVFQEVIELSVGSLQQYHETETSFNKEKFITDLNKSLQEDGESEIFYPHIYFEPELYLEKINIPISLEKDILNLFKELLSEAIVYNHIGIKLKNHKLFVFSNKLLLQVADALMAFFNSKILALHAETSIVQRELAVINMQEETHNEDKFPIRSFTFTVRRAAAVKKYLLLEKYEENASYPEELSLSIIEKLENPINERYEKERLEKFREQFETIKQRLLIKSDDWRDTIMFFSNEELDKYAPVIIDKLKKDRDISFTTWYTRKSEYTIFMGYQPRSVGDILEGISNLRGRKTWKMLAFRKLLEHSERIPESLNPFNSDNVYNEYISTFRTAYSPYTSYFYGILLLFNIGFLNKAIFKAVNHRIEEKQAQYEEAHLERKDRENQVFLKHIGQKKDEIKSLKLRNEILDELDLFYFHRKSIPLVEDIHSKFKPMLDSQFQSLLERFQFKLITVNESDDWKNKILFYPKTTTWNNVVANFKSKFGAASNSKNSVNGINTSDATTMKKLKAIQYLIERENIK